MVNSKYCGKTSRRFDRFAFLQEIRMPRASNTWRYSGVEADARRPGSSKTTGAKGETRTRLI